ncbi:Protein IN2-1-like protein B [Hibiscus syriacus]|uniref:Protein IN2-1-like protein B n=1 Tax=Hibiscus syriacus TaxID=106335 RepID=A0A6A3C0R7_HIBSY|nr:Protein IN2-1-like protein B [Hibiscus syriacus]
MAPKLLSPCLLHWAPLLSNPCSSMELPGCILLILALSHSVFGSPGIIRTDSGFYVPSLEHNGKVIGESLDLIKYVDSNFEGPSLSPNDPEKNKFLEELLSYVDKFVGTIFTSFKGDPSKEAGAAFDYLEDALKKYDGPFLLGQDFILADIAYIPFVERFQIFLSEVFKYDITSGRPKLAAWIEELNKIDAYKQTKITDPKHLANFTSSASWLRTDEIADILRYSMKIRLVFLDVLFPSVKSWILCGSV